MKYEEWLENWLRNYVEPTAKQRTYARYSEMVRRHIVPKLGSFELFELTPYRLQCFVTDMLSGGNLVTGRGLSANSVNILITVVQSSLKAACSLGYIEDYTAGKLKRPRPKERGVECFSLCEQKKIEGYILSSGNERLLGILICLYTGLRLGEILSLEWMDVDFLKSEINVNKSCHYAKDSGGAFGRITGTPKTISSIRIIPIPRQLVPILEQMKRKSLSIHVISKGEKSISCRAYQRSFETLLRNLCIPHRGFHSLRHTFATRALECGMDVKTLAEILGHKNPTITLTRYVHSLMEHKKDMMNLVGGLL